MSSVTTAWGYQMGLGNGPNTPYDTCGSKIQDRDPLTSSSPEEYCPNINLANPPYTAFIYAWAPNFVLLADPVVGNY